MDGVPLGQRTRPAPGHGDESKRVDSINREGLLFSVAELSIKYKADIYVRLERSCWSIHAGPHVKIIHLQTGLRARKQSLCVGAKELGL